MCGFVQTCVDENYYNFTLGSFVRCQRQSMPEYRIYRLASDGHFWGVPVIVECAQDQEAIEKARQMVDGLDLEIWEAARLIARFKANE
jgi:hypothetical protein